MTKRFLVISFLSFLLYTMSYGNSKKREYRKEKQVVSADSLLSRIKSGYEISLSECTISGDFKYYGDTIAQDIIISNSTFTDKFYFRNTHFLTSITLDSCVFKDAVSFHNTIFFHSEDMLHNVTFSTCVFIAPFNFSEVICSTDVCFNNTIFEDRTNFRHSKFTTLIQFNETRFLGYADFYDTETPGYIEFEGASFEAEFDKDENGTLYSGNFYGSNLINIYFLNADLSNVIMDLDTLSELSMGSLAFAKGLRKLKFTRPDMLSRIKTYFRQNHYRQSEREITCALKRHDQNLIEKIAFDYTTEYGSNFSRPFIILFWIWLIASVVYFSFLQFKKQSGLFVTITELDETVTNYEITNIFRKARIACFFSLLCTFNIGFRGFNFGRIIKLLLTKDMDFRPTGALRTVSAIQAILSVFLIGLWILSYFGRPFD